MRFSRKRIKGEKISRPPQSQTRPSPPLHITIGSREELLDKDELKGGSALARTRGAAKPPPPPLGPNFVAPTVLMEGRTVQAWVQ
jgi:hypothetical protein